MIILPIDIVKYIFSFSKYKCRLCNIPIDEVYDDTIEELNLIIYYINDPNYKRKTISIPSYNDICIDCCNNVDYEMILFKEIYNTCLLYKSSIENIELSLELNNYFYIPDIQNMAYNELIESIITLLLNPKLLNEDYLEEYYLEQYCFDVRPNCLYKNDPYYDSDEYNSDSSYTKCDCLDGESEFCAEELYGFDIHGAFLYSGFRQNNRGDIFDRKLYFNHILNDGDYGFLTYKLRCELEENGIKYSFLCPDDSPDITSIVTNLAICND